jgi:hypothetical protein
MHASPPSPHASALTSSTHPVSDWHVSQASKDTTALVVGLIIVTVALVVDVVSPPAPPSPPLSLSPLQAVKQATAKHKASLNFIVVRLLRPLSERKLGAAEASEAQRVSLAASANT